MTVGSNVDSKVQNVERRVDNLYDDLRRFEIDINSRLSSLEEVKAMFARIDEAVTQMNNQIQNLFYLFGKHESKVNQVILNKEVSQTARNPFECPDQLFQERNRKIEEIKHNLNTNFSTENSLFHLTKNNFDMKLENLDVKRTNFDFSKPTDGLSFNHRPAANTETCQSSKYQSSKLTVVPEQPSSGEKDSQNTSSAKPKI